MVDSTPGTHLDEDTIKRMIINERSMSSMTNYCGTWDLSTRNIFRFFTSPVDSTWYYSFHKTFLIHCS